MQATFLRLAAEGASSQKMADAAVDEWRAIELSLSPIVGKSGVAALYKRAIHLIRDAYPWLAAAHDGNGPFGDFLPLHTALSQQNRANAIDANVALYTSFHNILISLIGASLTQRLLYPLENSSHGDAVQDSSL
jgi:hypothetical protein